VCCVWRANSGHSSTVAGDDATGVLLDLWIMDLASHRFNFDTYLLCEEDADPKVHVV
jgi:hypothetical protein